jgi:hypothetical protein
MNTERPLSLAEWSGRDMIFGNVLIRISHRHGTFSTGCGKGGAEAPPFLVVVRNLG